MVKFFGWVNFIGMIGLIFCLYWNDYFIISKICLDLDFFLEIYLLKMLCFSFGSMGMKLFWWMILCVLLVWDGVCCI